MLIVAALGGNAAPSSQRVARRGGRAAQREGRGGGARARSPREHQLVITHGNGPQIGLLALQSEAFRDVRTYPLDVLGAESEGMIGYLLERELGNVLGERPVASLITQTVVDALDPAFRTPVEADRARLRRRPGAGAGARAGLDGRAATATTGGGSSRRRHPRSIVELPTIRLLLEHGIVVVCAGGGGVPVVVDSAGARHGVEAVVDKDLDERAARPPARRRSPRCC